MPELLRYQDGSIILVDANSEIINLPVCPLASIEQNEVPVFRRKTQFYRTASEHFGLWFVESSDLGPVVLIELRVNKEFEPLVHHRNQLKLFPLPEMNKTNQAKFVTKPWEIRAAARVLHLKLLSDPSKQPCL